MQSFIVFILQIFATSADILNECLRYTISVRNWKIEFL